MTTQRSIVIGGGAFAGLALALAIRQGLGPDVPVIVADPAFAVRPSRDPRASAIVAACRKLFDVIGVWGDVADQAQPIMDMVVTDSKLEDVTRPAFLTFTGHVEPGEPFAHMVENRYLIDALAARAEAAGFVTHWGRKILEVRPPVALNKGLGVGALLEATPVDVALYAGDDRTDIDAFDALRAAVADGRRGGAVCVGVRSDETPPELEAAADLLVDGPLGVRAVLETLAG